MQRFEEIIDLAAERQGGSEALRKALAETRPLAPADIAAVPDHQILSSMTRRVFYAGFSAKVIDAKWNAFEAAFDNFAPERCAWMTEERFDELLRDKGIVRNGAKIRSVQENARFVSDLAQQYGSAARFFSGWPDADYVGLLELLKKKASRLGGETGMRFLRSIGKPAFIPTPDVVKALLRVGVLAAPPSGKRDFQAMQAAFNEWSRQSGLDLTSLSRVLALSVG